MDSVTSSRAPKQTSYIPIQFSVHEYVKGDISSEKIDDKQVVNEGCKVLKHVMEDWRSVSIVSKDGTCGENTPGNVFQFNRNVPTIIPSELAPEPLQIKEWGTGVTEDEMYRLEELEEFIVTDLSFIYEVEKPSYVSALQLPLQPSSPGRSAKHPRMRDASPSINSKRRKLGDVPLVHIVPHIYADFSLSEQLDEIAATEEAIRTVKDARSTNNIWSSPPINRECETGQEWGGNVYQFRMVAPTITLSKRSPLVLRDWGAKAFADEIFSLQDLEEFCSMDLSPVFRSDRGVEEMMTIAVLSPSTRPSVQSLSQKAKASSQSSSKTKGKEKDETIGNRQASSLGDSIGLSNPKSASTKPQRSPTPGQNSPTTKRMRTRSISPTHEVKRRKLRIGSLVRLIPQPHMLPSPFIKSSVKRIKGKPYSKTVPDFIQPYTTVPSTLDTRVAWIVPVRGVLPWDKATSAEFLDRSHQLPVPPTESDGVYWTEDSLLKFWQFLCEMRKSGPLGSLGLSFHCARKIRQTTIPSNISSSGSIMVSTQNLSTVDYMKVYHDAQYTFYVRNAFDLWQYAYASEDDHSKKVRLLKGTKLVMVDEVSRGILVS